jgi:hypothetical protein
MFWHGRVLPPYALFCIQSFLDSGHRVRLFTYDDIAAPRGVLHADAEKIAKFDEMRRYKSVAAFSDFFRYELLHKEGGWWVDVDVVCLTDKLPEASHAWAEQEPGVINGAILKFPRGDPTLERLAASARQLAGTTDQWGAIGPNLLSNVLCASDVASHAGSTPAFYPLHWLEAPLLLLPEYKSHVLDRIAHATFLHLWFTVFDEIGVDLDRALPPSSLMHDFIGSYRLQPRPSLLTRMRTRNAVRRYWRQSWVLDHWKKVFGQLSRPPRVSYKLF